MGDDIELPSRGRTRHHPQVEAFVRALIVGAHLETLQLFAKLFAVSSCLVRVQSFLIAPHFENRKVIGPTPLLQGLEPHMARVATARLGVLPQQCDGLAGRRGHDFDVRDQIDSSVSDLRGLAGGQEKWKVQGAKCKVSAKCSVRAKWDLAGSSIGDDCRRGIYFSISHLLSLCTLRFELLFPACDGLSLREPDQLEHLDSDAIWIGGVCDDASSGRTSGSST